MLKKVAKLSRATASEKPYWGLPQPCTTTAAVTARPTRLIQTAWRVVPRGRKTLINSRPMPKQTSTRDGMMAARLTFCRAICTRFSMNGLLSDVGFRIYSLTEILTTASGGASTIKAICCFPLTCSIRFSRDGFILSKKVFG